MKKFFAIKPEEFMVAVGMGTVKTFKKIMYKN